MAGDKTSPGSRLVLVGAPGSELVQTLARLAREREIDAVPCANVYAAVVAVAQAAGRRVLVVGPMSELAVENVALLGIGAAQGVRCCCLLDPGRARGTQELRAAVRANATIVGTLAEARAVLQDWLAPAEPPGTPRPGRDASPTQRPVREETYDDWRATEAELSALLG
jgi:hypothetical protein